MYRYPLYFDHFQADSFTTAFPSPRRFHLLEDCFSSKQLSHDMTRIAVKVSRPANGYRLPAALRRVAATSTMRAAFDPAWSRCYRLEESDFARL
jgi:hypothetical protein